MLTSLPSSASLACIGSPAASERPTPGDIWTRHVAGSTQISVTIYECGHDDFKLKIMSSVLYLFVKIYVLYCYDYHPHSSSLDYCCQSTCHDFHFK